MWKRISEGTFLLRLSAWGGMLFYSLFSTIIWLISPKVDTAVDIILTYNLSEFIAGGLIIMLLFYVLDLQNRKKIIPQKVFMYLFIVVCYILSIVFTLLTMFIYNIRDLEKISFNGFIFFKGLNNILVIISFAGFYYLIKYWLNLKKQKEMTLIATNLANEAQLQMLRYQINPHFLFNALNTIRSMIEEDKTIARKMITELANFFRYSLSQNGTTDTFENEINAIKNYLEIQKIRFEEKLIITYDIDETLYKIKIPFFIILPLVENAIKFGLQSSKTPLTIKIFAEANDHLEISVHNTGHMVDCIKNSEGTKTGIENTKKRLSLYFPENYSFKLFEKDSWVIAQIIIYDYKTQIAD